MNEQEKAFINLCYLAQLVQKEEEDFSVSFIYDPKKGISVSLINEADGYQLENPYTKNIGKALDTFVAWTGMEGILLPDDWDNVDEGGKWLVIAYRNKTPLQLSIGGRFGYFTKGQFIGKDFFDE